MLMSSKEWRDFHLPYEDEEKELEEKSDASSKRNGGGLDSGGGGGPDFEEEAYIKELEENRYLISSDPIEEEGERVGEAENKAEKADKSDDDAQDLKSSAEEVLEDSLLSKDLAEKVVDILSERMNEENKISSEKEIDVSSDFGSLDLVRLLSSYKVSLDSSVRELVSNIKKRGDSYLREELRRILSDKGGKACL